MNEAFSTRQFCEWRRHLLEDLSWACYFARVYAAMSLLKLFQVQGIKPNHLL